MRDLLTGYNLVVFWRFNIQSPAPRYQSGPEMPCSEIFQTSINKGDPTANPRRSANRTDIHPESLEEGMGCPDSEPLPSVFFSNRRRDVVWDPMGPATPSIGLRAALFVIGQTVLEAKNDKTFRHMHERQETKN
ncbi:hypothetical protein BDM02DRAFT_2501295 [Thelephora ganbajun]|uniref:Uncharacterized protein n=1 Tax=Thelephora ganbajun TaxID=370292 RepID=A0ACB6ZEG5_THEGA|nr:hypothetical protein BDM02DRAFT_2501295 [Thelephora ganbajun]